MDQPEKGRQGDRVPHTNALIHEASPYLQQHAHNPVNWLPWSDAAFEQARQENKPVFLSVGYAACHWCHVMAHESFENEQIARLLNDNFVSIKVDREERPDVDHHYMQVVQRLTGQGGWPMSVFLTPERKAFFGGTYWPPESRYGRPGFPDMLHSVITAWKDRHAEILESADDIQLALADSLPEELKPGEIHADLLKAALRAAERSFDGVYGGFGGAPKFPHPMELNLLMRTGPRFENRRAREMVLLTLRKMARGGLYDQLGGGFHRYSTDARWLVPHFEKMLYDNALLAPVYLDAYLLTGDAEFQRVARETLDWALREMSVPEGGFASSLDADSEGVEGRFYVWTPAQVNAVLGEARGSRFARAFGVSESGNFEGGHSILNLSQPLEDMAERLGVSVDDLRQEFEEDRAGLLAERDTRVRPSRDDKVLADWNGLMISALVRGFAVLGDQRYLDAAQRTADRLLAPYIKSGKLIHSFLGERTLSHQLLLDYAALGNGLIDLFLADGNTRWFTVAVSLAKQMDSLFSGNGGLYVMSADIIAGLPPVDPFDSAVPSGNSVAGYLMARLFYLTGDEWYEVRARRQVELLADTMKRSPAAFGQAMLNVDLLLYPPAELVLMGDRDRVMWKVAQSTYHPDLEVIWQGADSMDDVPELSSLLGGKTSIGGRPAAYLCLNFTCSLPATSVSDLRQNLATLDSAKANAETR